MANVITVHTLNNGVRNLELQFNMVADGSGEESDTTLIDLNDYSVEPRLTVPSDFAVLRISGRTSLGVSFKLFFGALEGGDNRLFFEVPLGTAEVTEFSQDWDRTGGLPTLQANTDLTVRLTTTGFGASNDSITLNICIKKKYKTGL